MHYDIFRKLRMRDRQLFVKSTIANWTLHTGHFSSIGRGYFADLRMTRRRNNVRNVMFFAIFTDKERKKS